MIVEEGLLLGVKEKWTIAPRVLVDDRVDTRCVTKYTSVIVYTVCELVGGGATKGGSLSVWTKPLNRIYVCFLDNSTYL